MTVKQQEFCLEYIKQDFTNATKAYKKVYPKVSLSTAAVNASRLLSNPSIKDYISEKIQDKLSEQKISVEARIVDYWLRRAFYDITDIINLDGTLKMTAEQLKEAGLSNLLDAVDVITVTKEGQRIIKYSFANKDKAVDMLAKYVQMIKPQTKTLDIDIDANFKNETNLVVTAQKLSIEEYNKIYEGNTE